MSRQSRKPFIISEYVRWGDIDLAGIICYGAYLRFYELAEPRPDYDFSRISAVLDMVIAECIAMREAALMKDLATEFPPETDVKP